MSYVNTFLCNIYTQYKMPENHVQSFHFIFDLAKSKEVLLLKNVQRTINALIVKLTMACRFE